jgi:hypothetical protein
MQQYGAHSVYAFLSAATLWPVVETARGGEWSALAALGGVLAGVGGKLLANRIQQWKDEADATRQIASAMNREPDLRAELDAVLEKLQTFTQAREALPEADRPWFVTALRAELAQLGNIGHFEAQLTGSGAIAQGPGATAGGERSVIFTGGQQRGVINTGDVTGSVNNRTDDEPPIQGAKE